MSRGFLTIAYGGADYIRMAVALARSIRQFNPESQLAIVTDSNSSSLANLFNHRIPIDLAYGQGVLQKLHVDRYTPFDETVFIDSDCLVFGDVDQLWEMYEPARSRGFGVFSWNQLSQEDSHYGVTNMRHCMSTLSVQKIAAFNSGLFYFNKSNIANRVFQSSRTIANQAFELGLSRFKNSSVADEPVLGLAMAVNNVSALPWDDGNAMCTPTANRLQHFMSLNVLRGQSSFIRDGFTVNPLVVHFHLHFQQSYVYLREMRRLELGPAFGRWGLLGLMTLPQYARIRAGYYWTRLKQRFRSRGLLGIIPERVELIYRSRIS
jgi:hypothetical protein